MKNRCLMLAVGAAGCVASLAGSPFPAAAQAVAVRPLSEILAQGPEFTHPQPGSVTVVLETKIPVACSAVYGTTEAYGQIATDTDMAGGGHQKHHPVLTGLKPDTVYQIRMQGTGGDGTLYVSDNYTFHTPALLVMAAPSFVPKGKNVALASEGARVKAVSSNYDRGALTSSFGGNNAIDGDPGTQWSSNGDGDKAWIEIDLGKPRSVDGVGFQTRTMGTSAQIQSFRVIVDGGKKFGPFSLPDAGAVYDFPVVAKTRILRFEVVKSNGGNTGAAEIAVFGE